MQQKLTIPEPTDANKMDISLFFELTHVFFLTFAVRK